MQISTSVGVVQVMVAFLPKQSFAGQLSAGGNTEPEQPQTGRTMDGRCKMRARKNATRDHFSVDDSFVTRGDARLANVMHSRTQPARILLQRADDFAYMTRNELWA